MAPDDIGPDGAVRLRCYLPLADRAWLSGTCRGCGRGITAGFQAATDLMGSAEATIGAFQRRLRCRQCGERQVSFLISPDTRPADVRLADGPLPQTQGISA